MARKKRKKHTRIGFVSNIKINNKVIIIFTLLIVAVSIMFYGAAVIVSSILSENKKESERIISSAAEEYLNSAIERMVSVSKTVYTNESVYEFLNRRYQNTSDYFDRFYEFSQSGFPEVNEESAIKQFVIYTANDTVKNGGNISRLDSVENEEWYRTFNTLNRDMIIYCNADQNNLSLIRKLNYRKVQTGDSIIKLDFNPDVLQSSYMDMYFDGTVYVSSGNTLLYSNTRDVVLPSSDELDKYTLSSKNYYTCDIDYYVYANQKKIISLFSIPFAVPLMVLFVICLVIIITIITDFKNRTKEVCDICTEKKITKKIHFGEDEIGRLYNDVKNTIFDITRLNDEKNNLRRFINEYKEKTNDVIITALNFDTRIKFGLENDSDVSRTVSFDEELRNVSVLLDDLKTRELFRYSLISDTTSSEKKILPYSLSAIALHVARYEGTGNDIEIDVREHEGCYSIRYYKSGVAFSPADILKLRAIFEPESTKSLPAFEAEEEFNPYIRLSRFYLDDITFNINSRDEIDFEFIIASSTGTDNGEKK